MVSVIGLKYATSCTCQSASSTSKNGWKAWAVKPVFRPASMMRSPKSGWASRKVFQRAMRTACSRFEGRKAPIPVAELVEAPARIGISASLHCSASSAVAPDATTYSVDAPSCDAPTLLLCTGRIKRIIYPYLHSSVTGSALCSGIGIDRIIFSSSRPGYVFNTYALFIYQIMGCTDRTC